MKTLSKVALIWLAAVIFLIVIFARFYHPQFSPKTAFITPTPSQTPYYAVTKVIDGDTIDVSINGNIEKVRLLGINTPETVDPRTPVQCFGQEASNKAKEILTGKNVRLESDSTQADRDKYNRLLRYVYLEDGTFVNQVMIETGYAFEYTYQTPYKYRDEFLRAQKFADDNKLGLWSPDTCNGQLKNN